MLVEPREPYRVKAGIFELYSSFDANPRLFVSLDICVSTRFERDRASHSVYKPKTFRREQELAVSTEPGCLHFYRDNWDSERGHTSPCAG